MIEEIKTIKLSSKRQISIPTSFDLVDAGDKVIMEIEKDKIIIKPFKNYELDKISLANLDILKEDWLSDEDEKAYAHLQKYAKLNKK